MRIIALSGSPASLPALQLLHREGLLSALICATPAMGTDTTKIEAWALKKGIPCWQADAQTLDHDLAELTKEIKVDGVLVYGYPFKFNTQVLQGVTYGAWNVHFSLHPDNKGSITIHQLADNAGQNKILQQCQVNLLPMETGGSPIHQLSMLSVGLLQMTLTQLHTKACDD